MSFGKVYGYTANPRTRACLVAAEYAGVQVELVNENPVEGVSADYKQKFPLGKIPAFESSKVTLTQSVAIATYLAAQSDKAHLLGASKEQAAQVQMYAHFANMELLLSLGGWFAPLLGRVPYNKAAVEQAKTNANKALDVLEKELADRTFLVGERISLADIFVASVLSRGFEFVLDAAWRKDHTNTVRYFNTVANQPEFLKAIGGELKLCETAVVYTPPKKEAAKPAAPKAAAAAAAPAKKAAAEEDDEPAPAPKPKHPCEALGPAKSFPLDEFKRQYSNNDTPVAFKWFEEHYDPQEYSLWQAKYKYNDELGQPYQSNNLITGFHSRLEASRKYLFGNGAVYGSQGNSAIMGVYVIRGSNHEDIFSVAPDWESYDFVPLDLAKDRQLVLDSWSWEGSFNGLEHSGQAKTFK